MKEETICRTKIGFKRLTEESFAELVNASTQKTIVDLIKQNSSKCMDNVHNYNILSN